MRYSTFALAGLLAATALPAAAQKHEVGHAIGFAPVVSQTTTPTFDLGLRASTDPIAFGTPTAQIYVDGELGGTIDWNNTGAEVPMPPGACGFRVDGMNLLAWGWYEGGVYGTEFMNLQDNGDDLPNEPGAWIEFTGPYGPGCGDGYVVYTPATLDGVVPPQAVKLVLQFLDYDDLIFLDGALHPLEQNEGPGDHPDPEPPDPCEIVEFCEPARDFVNCFLDWNLESQCDEDEMAVDLSLTSFSATSGLKELAASLGRTTVTPSTNVGIALKAAQARLARARQQQQAARKKVGTGMLVLNAGYMLGRAGTALDFAQKSLDVCQAAANAIPRSRDPKASALAAAGACTRAADQMLDLHEAAGLLANSLGKPRK